MYYYTSCLKAINVIALPWLLLCNAASINLHLPRACRHERYLGMWVEDMKCGPGMVVSSSGTYCEATFSNGTIAVSLDNHSVHCFII